MLYLTQSQVYWQLLQNERGRSIFSFVHYDSPLLLISKHSQSDYEHHKVNTKRETRNRNLAIFSKMLIFSLHSIAKERLIKCDVYWQLLQNERVRSIFSFVHYDSPLLHIPNNSQSDFGHHKVNSKRESRNRNFEHFFKIAHFFRCIL